MLINLKEKNSDKIVVRDYLDIDFAMEVVQISVKEFVVVINNKYQYAEIQESKEEAEQTMLTIMENRNALERELRDF